VPERPAAPPRVTTVARCTGSLAAGAAESRFQLPDDVPIAGFARWSYESAPPRGPVGARALVLTSPGCAVALASAEILLVPEALEADVLARVSDLGLNGVVLAATHTHAGPGGYWQHVLGERIATGPYDDRFHEAIVAGVASAIRRAAGAIAPARVAIGRGSADDLARSRSGGVKDAPLTVLRVERHDGSPIAEVTIFAAHATLLGKGNRSISGDWPGRFAARTDHGVRLLLPGAIGDQSADGPSTETPDAFAGAVSDRVERLTYGPPDPEPQLAFAEAHAVLPRPELGAAPAPLRRAAANLAYDLLPRVGRVQAVRIGEALLVAVPAEPVAAVARDWREALPAGATIVSLAGGYLGYVEAPERMARGAGETDRTYYGPDLARRLGAAVQAVAAALPR
jgi:hypothetical protein